MKQLKLLVPMISVLWMSGCSSSGVSAVAGSDLASSLNANSVWSSIAAKLSSKPFMDTVKATGAMTFSSYYRAIGLSQLPSWSGQFKSLAEFSGAYSQDISTITKSDVTTAIAVFKKSAQGATANLTMSDSVAVTHLMVFVVTPHANSLVDYASDGLTPQDANGQTISAAGTTGNTANGEINQHVWCNLHPTANNCDTANDAFYDHEKTLSPNDRKAVDDAETVVMERLQPGSTKP